MNGKNLGGRNIVVRYHEPKSLVKLHPHPRACITAIVRDPPKQPDTAPQVRKFHKACRSHTKCQQIYCSKTRRSANKQIEPERKRLSEKKLRKLKMKLNSKEFIERKLNEK